MKGKKELEHANAMAKLYRKNRDALFSETSAAMLAAGYRCKFEVRNAESYRNTTATIEQAGVERELIIGVTHQMANSYSSYSRATIGHAEVSVPCVSPSRTLRAASRFTKDRSLIYKPVKGNALAKVLIKAFGQLLEKEEKERERNDAEREANRIARHVNAVAGRNVCFVPWCYRGQTRATLDLLELDEGQMVALVKLLRDAKMLDVLRSDPNDDDA
jgi:hypothetical protein